MQRELHSLGYTSHLEIDHPRENLFTIAAFELESAKEPYLKVTGKHINVSYRWYQLLLLQRIEHIQVGELTLQLNSLPLGPIATDSASNSQFTTIEPAQLIPKTWLSKLPFQSLTVESAILSTTISSKTALSWQGKLTVNEQILTTSGQYFEDGQAIASAKLSVESDNSFTLKARVAPATNSSISNAKALNSISLHRSSLQGSSSSPLNTPLSTELAGHITHQPSGVRINAKQLLTLNQLAPFSVWVKEILPTQFQSVLTKLETQLDIQHQIDIGQEPNGPANLQSFTSQFSLTANIAGPHLLFPLKSQPLKGLNIEQSSLRLTGSIKGDNRQLQIAINPYSQLQIEQLTSQDIRNRRLQLALNSEVSISCQLPCSSLTHQKLQSSLNNLQFNVSAAPWQFKNAKFKHSPINLKLTQLDLAKRNLAVEVKMPEGHFISDSTTSKLPFKQLTTQRVEASIEWNGQTIALTLAPQLTAYLATLNLAEFKTARLKVTNRQPLSLLINPLQQNLSFHDARFNLQAEPWKIPGAKVTHDPMTVDVAQFDWLQQKLSAQLLAPKITVKKDSPAHNGRQLPFETFTSALNVNLELQDKQLTLKQAKNGQIVISKLALDAVRSKQLTINNPQPLTARSPFDLQSAVLDLATFDIQPASLHIKARGLHIDRMPVAFKNLNLTFNQLQLAPLKLQLNSSIKGLQLALPNIGKQLQKFDVSASHWLNKQRYTNKFTIKQPDLTLQITGKVQARNQFDTVSAQWQLAPLALEQFSIAKLRAISAQWPAQLQVIAGTYSHSGEFNKKSAQLSAQLNHQLKDMSLQRDQLVASGINLQSKTRFNNQQLTEQGQLVIGQINSTLPITNIRSQYQLSGLLNNQPVVELHNSGADLLGTRIKIKQLRSPLTPLSASSSIEFSQLPLNNILALETQPSLTGTGLLSGTLPFKLKKNKIWITDGQVKSIDKGTIRYIANDKIRAMATSNKGLEIALDVLDNFHYDKLSITANYTPDGKLLLANNLSGSNPDWQNGQPIDFTINLEENLLQLLKTLQFSDNLEQQLQRKVQQQVKP